MLVLKKTHSKIEKNISCKTSLSLPFYLTLFLSSLPHSHTAGGADPVEGIIRARVNNIKVDKNKEHGQKGTQR